MNDLVRNGDKRMTVKEVAEALGVSDRTIRDNVARLFPGIAENGKTTYLNEEQVTAIKQAIERSGRTDLANVRQVGNVTTALEIEEMTIKVLAYHEARVKELEAELAANAPKIESFNALMSSENDMCITDAAKHFGLHPRLEVLPYLREHGYLTSNDLPTQAAIDAGYLVLKEERGRDDVVRQQARVLASQLETWRTRVIPQIQKWVKEA